MNAARNTYHNVGPLKRAEAVDPRPTQLEATSRRTLQ